MMSPWLIRLLAFLCSGYCAFGGFYLKSLSYTKLPTTLPPKETFGLFGGTAEEAAYDPKTEMLYVVGKCNLHILQRIRV